MAQVIVHLTSVFMFQRISVKFQCFAIVKTVPGKKFKDKSKNILSQPVLNYVRRHEQCDSLVAVQPNVRVLESSQWFTKCFIKTGLTGRKTIKAKASPWLGFPDTLASQSISLNTGNMGALILIV